MSNQFTLYLKGSFISQKKQTPLRLLNMISPKTCSCLISVSLKDYQQ